MNNPDWRSMCAELLETIDMLLEGDRRPEGERSAYIRALLAQPESEVKRIDLDAIKQAIEERDEAVRQYHDLAQSMVYHGNSVAHWYGKATAYRDAIGKVWNELQAAGIATDGNKTCADGVRELAARNVSDTQPEPQKVTDDEIDEESATLIAWLLEEATQAANSDAPYAAGKLNLAAQLLERLSQPEPVAPTDEEIYELFDWMENEWRSNDEREFPLPLFARAVLARWGRPAIEPVTVSERPILRSNPFNNSDGHCWCGSKVSIDATGDLDVVLPASWELREPCPQDDCVLPHHDLPVPKDCE